MDHEQLIERFFEILINGDRRGARTLVETAEHEGFLPDQLLTDLFWPAYEMVEKLFRNDQMTRLSYHLATRLLRSQADQASAKLEYPEPTNRSVFAVCGPNDADELGAQIAVDLLEHNGFGVTFAGGGIANDEIMAQVHEEKPQALLLFASAPSDLPEIRALIDTIREINATPDLQIIVGGGVFNRAEGLAEEIGADLWAQDPVELVDLMIHEPAQRATEEQRTVGRTRRPTRAAA